VNDTTKDEIVGMVNMNMDGVKKDTADIKNTVIDNISEVVERLAKDTGKSSELIESIRNIVSTNIHGVIAAEKNVEDGIKNVAIGILKGLKSSGQEIFSSISVLAGAIIMASVDSKADVAAVSKGMLSGIVQSANEMGIDAGKAAYVAASSAITAASKVDKDLGSKVKKAATGPIEGNKIMLKEPFMFEDEKMRIDISR
jgi:hypothetical protein